MNSLDETLRAPALMPEVLDKDDRVRDALLTAEAFLRARYDEDSHEPLVKVRAALAALRGAKVLALGGGASEDCWIIRGDCAQGRSRWYVVLGCGFTDAREFVRDEMPTYVRCRLSTWALTGPWNRNSPVSKFVFSKE